MNNFLKRLQLVVVTMTRLQSNQITERKNQNFAIDDLIGIDESESLVLFYGQSIWKILNIIAGSYYSTVTHVQQEAEPRAQPKREYYNSTQYPERPREQEHDLN